MAIDHLERSWVAVHPHTLHSHRHVQADAPPQSPCSATAAPDVLAQLEALLREHEPHRVRQASDLLRIYAGMEQELLQCYRHHYTGTGGFRVPASAPSRTQHHATVFSLPKAAIATYLREKLRARRAQHSSSSSSSGLSTTSSAKGDDMRSPELLLRPAAVPSAERHRNRGDQDAPVRTVAPLTTRQTTRTTSCQAVRPLPLLHRVVPRPLAPSSSTTTAAAAAATGAGHTVRRAA